MIQSQLKPQWSLVVTGFSQLQSGCCNNNLLVVASRLQNGRHPLTCKYSLTTKKKKNVHLPSESCALHLKPLSIWMDMSDVVSSWQYCAQCGSVHMEATKVTQFNAPPFTYNGNLSLCHHS